MAAAARLFTAGLSDEPSWPKWYYQDLSGELQGPFDAATMIRWYSDNQLPSDLKCVGVYPQDCATPPTNLAQFQPLQKLMDNAEAGMQYTPVRMTKGALGEEGPATPQSAIPPKGSRATAPAGNHVLPQHAGGSVSAALAQQLAGLTVPSTAGGQSDTRSDVTRAVDQRFTAGMPPLTAQQLHMQGQGLLHQLHAQQQQRQQMQPNQQRGGSAPRQMQQQPARSANTARVSTSANSSLHEQHMQQMQQLHQPAVAAPSTATSENAATAADIQPGTDVWNNALTKLLSREGFTGKDADLKWRVILASGDRVGPFTADQMTEWLQAGTPPKGINKQQAGQTAADPAALQVCGIIASDYNAQRLPGAKFFKPLGQLLPAVAAGLTYDAVNKHDLQRGIPKPNWNEPGNAAAATAAPTAATGLPAGPAGKGNMAGGKAGKAARQAGNSNSRNASAGRGGNQQQQQQFGINNRPRSGSGMAGAAAAAALDGMGGAPAAAPKSTFQHPMALRQQQRQQQQQDEALSAAAAAACEALGGPRNQQRLGRGPGSASAGSMQGNKSMDKGGFAGRNFANTMSGGSASRGILMAANSMGGMAAAAAAAAAQQPQQQQQQQQAFNSAAAAQAAALAAAAGQLGPAGLAAMRQQQAAQQLQLQMQGFPLGTPTAAAAAAYMQGAAQGMPQAIWFKQQQQQPSQVPGQTVANMFSAQQSLLGYQMQAGYAAMNQATAAQTSDAAAGGASASDEAAQLSSNSSSLLPNGGLPRTSSSDSAVQQQGQDASKHSRAPSAGSAGPHSNYSQQQQYGVAAAMGNGALQDWQQQQQGGEHATAAHQVMAGQPQQPLTPQHMQAAAMLFLQHEQQQQQLGGSREAVRWWVQRSERAFAGPYSGMQMYQSYLQPSTMGLTDSTCIAAMAAGGNSRDMPAAHAFAPFGALLEAAIQGYCLVPCTAKDSVQQAGPAGGSPPQVRHLVSGQIAALQQVVPALLVQQQQQAFAAPGQRQSVDSGLAGAEQLQAKRGGPGSAHAGISPAAHHAAVQRTGSGIPPSPQKARAAAAGQQQLLPGMQVPGAAVGGAQFVATPGGGLVAIPPGAAAAAMMPGATVIPAAGIGGAGIGSVMTPQGVPMVAAPAPIDPMAVASALFTAGNVPPPMAPVWFVLAAATEPQGPPKIQGPYEPADMLSMFREQRIGPGSMVCATHRPVPGQPPTQPPTTAFQPLQALLATTNNDLMCQQVNAAAAMGGHMGQMVPAAALMQGGQMGQMPIMIQVPVSGAQGGSAMAVAVPAGMQVQMQQLHQMQMQAVPQGGAVSMAPYMQPGGILVPQQMAPAAAMQHQQHGGSDGRSHSNPAASAAAQQPGQQQAAQRSGPVPTRVDTWGSLDAHDRTPSSNTLSQQQMGQQLSAQNAHVMEAVRRTSAESHHSHATAPHSSSSMIGMGMHWLQQQQQQHGGPRSSNSGNGYHQFHPQQHQQQVMVRRTSSGSTRSNVNSGPASSGHDAAGAAAVAAALAHAGSASSAMLVAGPGSYGLHLQQQQQQLHSAFLAGMAQSAAMAGIPEHQQQLLQPQQLQQQPQVQPPVVPVSAGLSPTPSEGAAAVTAAEGAAAPASVAASPDTVEAASQSSNDSQQS